MRGTSLDTRLLSNSHSPSNPELDAPLTGCGPSRSTQSPRGLNGLSSILAFATGRGSIARAFAAAAMILLLAVQSAHAANQTWNGNSNANNSNVIPNTDANWSIIGNWVGNAAPGSTTVKNNTDVATFSNLTGPLAVFAVTIDSATQNIGSITFDTAGAPAYTIGSLGAGAGNSLFLTNGGTIQITSAVGPVTDTINAPLLLEGGYTVGNNSLNSTNALSLLAIRGPIALDAGAASSILTINGAGNTTISGVISNGGNTLGLTTSGTTGTYVLSGANTYTGITTLGGGILNVGVGETSTTTTAASGPLGKQLTNAANTILFSGGTLQYSGANQFDYSARFSTAANQLISIDTNGQNVTFATALTSAGGTLTKLGTGTLTLSGANTYTGVTTISLGTLNLNKVESAGTSGPLGKSAAVNPGSIVFNGGTLQYTANNTNDYSGRFSTANNQPIRIDTNGQNVTFGATTPLVGTGTTLTKIGGGTLTLSAANTYTGVTALAGGNLNVNATETAGTSGPLGNQLANAAGTIFFAGGTLQYSAANNNDYSGRFSTAPAQAIVIDTNGVNVSFGTALTSPFGSLTKNGNGTLTLNAAESYTNGTTVNAGTLQGTTSTLFGNISLAATTANVTFNQSVNGTYAGAISGSATGNGTVTITGGGTVTLTASNNFSNAAIITGANSGLTGTTSSVQNAITTAVSSNLVTFNQNFSGTYSGVLSGPGSLALTATTFTTTGSTLTLSGANTYTGTTTLNTGTFNLNRAEIAGTSGPLGNSIAANPGNIIFAGGTLQYSGNNQNDYSGRFSIANNQPISIDTNGQSVTFATALTSSGGTLTKLGGGTLILSSGANTYSGGTTVSGGVLQGTTNSLQGDILDNANVTFNQNFTGPYAGAISGTGGVTITGGSTVTLSGASTYTGATTVNAATLTLAPSGSLTGASLAVTGGNFNAGNASGTVTLNGLTVNTGGATIRETAAGTLALGALALRSPGGGVNFATPGSGFISTSSTGSNGILGGFATLAGADWAVGGGNITALNAPGGTAWTDATTNLNLNGNSNASNASINSLRFSTNNPYTVTLVGTNTITSGGILVSPVVGNIGSTITGGSLTTGNAADLIVNEFDASGSLTINSVIANNGGTPIGLTLNGVGTLVLSAANSYGGPTWINGGTLKTNSAGALPITTSVIVNGTLDVAGTAQSVASISGNLFGTITNTGAAATLSTGTNNASTTFAGTVANGSGLTLAKTGFGTLTLSGTSNTFSGLTVNGGGQVTFDYSIFNDNKIAASAPVTLTGSSLAINSNSLAAGSQTIGGLTINGGTNVGLTANGGQTFTLNLGTITRTAGSTVNFGGNGTNPGGVINSASLATTSNGWASFGGNNWAVLPTGGGSTIGGVGTAGYESYTVATATNLTSAATDYQAAGVTTTAGGLANSLQYAGGVTLTLTPALTISTGGILISSGVGGNSSALSGSTVTSGGSELIVIQNNNGGGNPTGNFFTINSTIVNGAGGVGLTKSGIGTLVLTNTANSFSGPTVVNAGAVLYTVAGAQGTTSGITINAGGTIAVTSSFVNPLTVLTPLITANSTGTVALSFTNPDAEAFAPAGPVFLGAAAGTYATYTGAISPVAGNYRFGGGGVGQLTVTSSLSGSNGVIVSGIPASMGIANNAANTSAGSAINTMPNNAGGQIALENQNTYTGGTLVVGGGNAAVLQLAANSVVSGGTLQSGAIGTGTLTLNGGGVQDNSSNIVVANALTINGSVSFTSAGNGTLTFSGNGLTTPPTVAILGNPTFDVRNIATTIAEPISGPSGFTKNGIGNLILSGANTYTGATTVNGNLGWGNLQFNSPTAIGGSGASVTVNAGGTVAAGPGYTNLQTTFFNRIVTTSAGTIGLSASTADNFDWSSGGANLTTSLGAAFGSSSIYSGTLTPNGTTYSLGGGGGTLRVTSAFTGAGNSLNVFSGNTNGNVVLSGSSTYGGGTTINGTQTPSYFNPAVGNNTTPGNMFSILQVASNSAVSGGSIVNGPLGTGTVNFAAASSLADNGTNVTVANSFSINTTPIAWTSPGSGSLIFDGPAGSSINVAGINQPGFRTIQVDNTTIVKTPMTGTFGFIPSITNPTLTISGTGTLVLAAQSTYNFAGPAGAGGNGQGVGAASATTNDTVLFAGPTLRFGASTTVTGAPGSQTLVSGPMGLTTLAVNGGGNVGTFIQDNGTNITIANPLIFNLNGTAINFDSTGNGSITFDGTGLSTPSQAAIFAGTVQFITDNTVRINDAIINSPLANRAIQLTNNNQKYPYGTLILGSSASTFGTYQNTAANGLGFTGTGFIPRSPVPGTTSTTLSFGILELAANSQNGVIGGVTFVTSGPVGVGKLSLTGNSGSILEDNGTDITIENNVDYNGSQYFMSAGSGTGSLTFDWAGLTTPATFNINGNNAGGNPLHVFNTTTIKDQVTGGNPIQKVGSGTLILANTSGNPSTYSTTAVNQGLLQINNQFAFGTGNSTVNFGGTLAAGPSYPNLQTTFFNKITNTSLGTIAITGSTNDNFNWSTATGVNFISASFGAVGGTLASPVVYGNGGTTFTPNGSVYHFGGGGGFLQVNAPLNSANSLVVGGLGGGAGASFTIGGLLTSEDNVNAGTVTLGGLYTGSTVVNSGNLQLNVAPGVPANFAGIINLNPGTAVSAGSGYGSLTPNLLPLINSASTGALALTSSTSENLSFTALPTVSLGAAPVAGGVTYSGTLTPANGTYRVGGGGGTLTISSNLTGANSLVVNGNLGTGTVIPTGTNTFSGGTLLGGGTLQLNSSTVGTTSITSGPIGTGTLTLTGGTLAENGGAITLANSVLVVGGATFSGDTGSMTFDGTGLTSPATFTVVGNPILTVTNTTTIKDVISGTIGFAKAGGGTLVLSGANTYSGTATVLNGTLKAGASGTLPSASTLNIILGPNNSSSGTFDLNGTSQSIDQLTGSGIVTNSAGGAGSLNIGGNGGSSSFAGGTIQDGTGAVSLTKSGGGVLTLGSGNTYSGGTTVSGGALRVVAGGNATLQAGAAGTVLTNASGSTTILSGPVGTGTLTLGGGSTLQDSGFATALANSISLTGGTVTISSPSATVAFPNPNSGSLTLDGTALAAPATVNVTAPTALAVNNTTTIADKITGGNGLTMSGSGTLILSSTTQSTYTTMTVNSGVVQYNATTAVGSGSITVNNGGTVAVGGSVGVSVSSTGTATPITAILPFIATGSTGTVALTGNDSENVSFDGYSGFSLGATGIATYSGTLTPNGTTYELGGGGGTLTVTSALSGGNTLTVGGNTAGGGSGGTVVLSNPLNSTTTVNSGVLQLSAVGTGNITVANGGAVATGPSYAATSATPITSSLLPLINTGSQGTLALTSSTGENLNFASYPNLSLGAAAGAGVNYTGTLTQAGTTYRLGGGGGTLTVSSALTGSGNSVVVGGNGSGGTVILGGTNTYGTAGTVGTTVTKGTLAVGPNSSALGAGDVKLNGGTLALLPFSAPLAATGYNYDSIWGAGETSPQSAVTSAAFDAGELIYQKGVPGSLAIGGGGMPASRSFVSYNNPNTVFQMQPYNAKNALQLSSAGVAGNTVGGNAAAFSKSGTLTLSNPGSYSNLSVLNTTSNGNIFFTVTLNFADGTSQLVPNTTSGSTGNLPNYFTGDWFGPPTYNVNTAQYTFAYFGGGSVTQQNNNGTFQGNNQAIINNDMATPRAMLFENDITVPLALQNKTLVSVTFDDVGGFNGINNGSANPGGHMNFFALSGTLTGATSGAATYINNLSVAAGTSSTIDLQSSQTTTVQGTLAMGDGSTLNVTNSTSAVNFGATGFNVALGSNGVLLPTTGTHTTTFNVSAGTSGNTVNLSLGGLDDGSTATPAVINITGSGSVTFANNFATLTNPTVNVNSGGTLIVALGGGLGSTAQVNVASGATLDINGTTAINKLSGAGSVAVAGNLMVGSTDNLNSTFSGMLSGLGTVQNGGTSTLSLNGGGFHANTTVNSSSPSVAPSVVAGSTMALGNTVTLAGGMLRLNPTPGTATLSGFGGNFGQYFVSNGAVQSNGWSINSNTAGVQGTGNSSFPLTVTNYNILNPPNTLFPSKDVLQLSDGGGGEARNAFYMTPVPYANGSAGFTASYTFQADLTKGADGIAFILQNDPRGAAVLGGGGGSLGYAGIVNSIGLHLDVFNNSNGGGVGTGLGVNGTIGQFNTPVKYIDDGDPINIIISYNPTALTLTETLTDSLVPANTFTKVFPGVDLSKIIGGSTAYVGFGGATGGVQARFLISNFSYSLSGGTPGSYTAGVATTGIASTIDLAATAATPNFSTSGGISGSGGQLTVSDTTSPAVTYGMTFNGASSLSGPLALNVAKAGSAVTFAAPVSGAGSISNTGPGNVVLSVPNFYTGGTGTGAASGKIVASSNAALSSGAVTLGGGTLTLAAPLPAGNQAPLPIGVGGGWNVDVIIAKEQIPSTIIGSLQSFDNGGTAAAGGTRLGGSALFENGTPGSPSGSGLPVAPAQGAPASFTSAFNPNVTFQFQPYSTATGGLSNNALNLNGFGTAALGANVAGTLTLATPGHYASLNVLNGTGNGPGIFNMTLNFSDAAPLTVTNIPSLDWFANLQTIALATNGRFSGTTFQNLTNNGTFPNPVLHEFDFTLPAADQAATLQSITFNYVQGGEMQIMAVSGQAATTNIPVNVTADSTIDVTGTATSGLTGLTTIGNNTLHVTGGSTGAGVGYTLSLGTNGGVMVTSGATFDVANNGGGAGLLVLGALNDSGNSIDITGNGATTLASAATTSFASTAVTVHAGATLNSNAAGTSLAGGSLGQFATMTVAGTFNVNATQTIGALNGGGSVFLANGTTLTIGNTDNQSGVFSGAITDGGSGSPGSINVGGGIVSLSGANSYHGGTTVSAGMLQLVTASTNNITNSPTVTVLSGGTLVTGSNGFTVASGQTLQGAFVTGGASGGTVTGPVTVASGGRIGGYSTTTTASLTVNVTNGAAAVTLPSGSNSDFTLEGDLGTPFGGVTAFPALIATTSNGAGPSLNITGANTVNILGSNTAPVGGSTFPTEKSVYHLFSYTGTALSSNASGSTLTFTNGGSGTMTLGQLAQSPALSYSYTLSNTVTGKIDLIVTPLGLSWAGVDNPDTTGTPTDSIWNTTSNNWVTSAGASAVFASTNQVIFGDSYLLSGGPVPVTPNPQIVTVQAGGVNTGGVTFGNNTVAYKFQNTGADTNGISGSGPIQLVASSATPAPVTFDAPNSFSGAVSIVRGQLNLGNADTAGANGLGQSSGVTVSSGATLNLNSTSGASVAYGNGWNGAAPTGTTIPLTLNGAGPGGTGAALNSQSGNNTYAGQISIGSSGGASISAAAPASVGDGLTLNGGINNASLTTPATVTFTGTGNIAVSGAVTDAGTTNALSVLVAGIGGAGSVTFSNSGNTYHGSTTFDPGLLILATSKGLGNSSSVTVPAMGGLVLSGSGTAGLRATGNTGIPLSLTGTGTGSIIPGTAFNSVGALIDIGTSGYNGPITLPADATIATTASGDVLTLGSSTLTLANGSVATPRVLTFVGPGSTTVSDSVGDGGAAAPGGIVVNGLGDRVTLSGSNSYRGSTTVDGDSSGGTLILQNAFALGNTSGVTVNSGGALVLAGANNATYGLKATGSAPIALGLTGAGNGANGALTGGGANITSTYAGPITINSPGATISTSAATAVLNLTGAVNSTGTTVTLSGPGTVNVNGGLNINTGALSVTVASGGTASISAVNPITDGATSGTVTMSGAGTLNLLGSNSYLGGTFVNSGLTVAGNTASLGSGAVTLGGGILRVSTLVPQINGFGGGVGATSPGWTVNSTGIASAAFTAANVLRLTDGAGNEARSAFNNSRQPINHGFVASFTYTPSGTGTLADGAALILQNDPRGVTALGGAGGALGLNGITPSAELELNIYNGHTIGSNFVTDQTTGNYNSTSPVNFLVAPTAPRSFNIALAYNAATTTVTETVTDPTAGTTFNATYSADLAGLLGNLAYVGFSGATGGSVSTQQISNFSFAAGQGTPVYDNLLTLNPGAASTIDVAATAAIPTVIMGNLTVTGPTASTLNVTATTAPANVAYGLTLGNVTLNGGVTFNVANNGTGTGTLTLGALSDGGSTQIVTILGAGNVVLNNGTTSLAATSSVNVGPSNGNLVVTNTSGSATGSALVNVNNGGKLSGTGAISGAVTVIGGGTIAGSNAAALAGTPLMLNGGLALTGSSPNSNSSFNLTATPNGTTNPMINVAGGSLTVSGTNTVKLTGTVPTIVPAAGNNYVYDLFAYTGTVSTTPNGTGLTFGAGSGGGNMSLDSVANLPLSSAYNYSLSNNVALSQIDLILTYAGLTWTGQTGGNGATNGSWDISTSTNWATPAPVTATTYVNPNAVQFADGNPITAALVPNTANVATVTIVAAGVQPSLVSFSNTGPGNGGVNYKVLNAGTTLVGISGSASVAIQGVVAVPAAGNVGQVTFDAANSFTGAVSITNNSQLNLGDGATAAANGIGNALGNASSVTVASGTTLNLNSVAAASVTFGTGWNGAAATANKIPLTLNGVGTGVSSSGAGALNSQSGNNTYTGPITIGSLGATIASTLSTTTDGLTFTGIIADAGGSTLTFVGPGKTTLAAANTYSDSTVVTSGSTVLTNASALGNSLGATVSSGGALALSGGIAAGNLANGTGTIPLTLNGAGVTTTGTFANVGALANSGANTYAGPITLATSSTIGTIASGDVLTLPGVVGGGAGALLTVKGPGRVNLSGQNTYAGGTTLSSTLSTTGLVAAGNTSSLGTGTVTLNAGTLRLITSAGGAIVGFGGTSTDVSGTGTSPRWFVNNTGITSIPITSNVLTLTDGVNNEARSAWFNSKQPVVSGTTGFSASFTYTPSGAGTRADGITFVLQNDAAATGALGAGGGGLGYSTSDQATGTAAIAPSVAWEINIYNGHTIGTNFVDSSTVPATLNFTATGAVNVNSGDPINVLLSYNATTHVLTETDTDATTNATFTTSYNKDIVGALGASSAFVGFTGATGGSNATQRISNFQYGLGTPGTYVNNVVLPGAATATIDLLSITTATPSIAMGTLAIGAGGTATLNVTDATDSSSAAYILNFGATTLNSSVTFNVANSTNGNALGTLQLGAVTESGGSFSVTKTGVGTLLLPAVSNYTGGTTVTNGTVTTTSTGSLGTGTLTVSAATGITSTVNLGSNQTVTSLSGTVAGTGISTLNVAAGTTLTVNQSPNTQYAGTLALAGGASAGTGGKLTKSGVGTLELDGVPTLGNNSAITVGGGSLKLAVTGTATPSVGVGVTASVTGTAVLELAGTVSTLGTATANQRVNITNTSTATTGILVSNGNHQVGGIDGTGTTQVNTGASLTANHIVQSALVIGGTSTTGATVTIAASSPTGAPLGASSGLALAGSLAPSEPFGSGTLSSSSLASGGDSSSASGSGLAGSAAPGIGGGNSSVPEPSSMILLVLGSLAYLLPALRRRIARKS